MPFCCSYLLFGLPGAGSEEIALFLSSSLRCAFPLLEEAGRRLHLLTRSSCVRIRSWAERGQRANEGSKSALSGFSLWIRRVPAGRKIMRLCEADTRCNPPHGMDPSYYTWLRYLSTAEPVWATGGPRYNEITIASAIQIQGSGTMGPLIHQRYPPGGNA